MIHPVRFASAQCCLQLEYRVCRAEKERKKENHRSGIDVVAYYYTAMLMVVEVVMPAIAKVSPLYPTYVVCTCSSLQQAALGRQARQRRPRAAMAPAAGI